MDDKGLNKEPETAEDNDESSYNDLLDDDICGLCGLPGADKYAHPNSLAGRTDSRWYACTRRM